ncbi:MAG: hypothetical protein CW338_03965 [Clostridiales bacterium]|nr:hypothetical protein [Clostridiales bacterium]
MDTYFLRKCIRKVPGVVIRAVKLPEPVLTEGFGKRDTAGEFCRKCGYKSVLLVTDPTLYALGHHYRVVKSLQDANVQYDMFSGISGEPDEDTVREGRAHALKVKADAVIALGGGSVLDTAKMIAATAAHGKIPLDLYWQKMVFGKTLPMINIPSTAGTGAEITAAAVVKDKKGVKKSTVFTHLRVTDVILDSELTQNAPDKITVSCGIDALSHGLEGCLADVKVKDEDMRKSRECVRIVMQDMLSLRTDPHNTAKRQEMALAAHYGGNAINRQLAGYVHAFAHTLGAFYHISHGDAIAYCLLPVIAFQKEICGEKLAALSVYCGYAKEEDDRDAAARALLDRVKELLIACGYGDGMKQIDEKDYPVLVKGVDSDAVNYSPAMVLTDEQVASLLDQIKKGIA